jgi:hypothetical protein
MDPRNVTLYYVITILEINNFQLEWFVDPLGQATALFLQFR